MEKKMRNHIDGVVKTFVLITMSWILSSCKSSLPVTPGDPIPFPTKVSYSKDVQRLFDQTCALAGCHDAAAHAGTLALDSWSDALLSDTGVVIVGDTTNSRLVWRIEGTHSLKQMPADLPPLNANEIAGLKRWILQGAQNN